MDLSEPPSHFVGTVEFDESMNSGEPSRRNPISLDINVFRNMPRSAEDNAPQKIADNIAAVAETLRGYNNIHDGIWVYVVPGDDKRGYRDEKSAKFKAAHEHVERQLRGGG